MSDFAIALNALIELRGFTFRDLEAKTGIDYSTFSRLASKESDTRASRKNLAAILQHVCKDDREQFQLLAAHVRDELRGAGVDPKSMRLVFSPGGLTALSLVDDETRANLEMIAIGARNTDTMKKLVGDLAALVKHAQPYVLAAPKRKKKGKPVDIGPQLTPSPRAIAKTGTG